MNLNEMTKAELIEELTEHYARKSFRCIHGHTGHSHRNCFDRERGLVHRVGFFDIETFELLADWGFAFCYSIKKLDGEIIKATITGKEVLNWRIRDKRIIKQFCKDVKNFDHLVVYYGKDTGGRYQRHDIPFMRTRAERWGIKDFPKEKELVIIDLYDVVKAKFKMKSNSMKHICKLLKIPCKQTPIDWDVWQRARDGSDRDLKIVQRHCDEDVVATELLFKEVYPYKRVRTLI
ncbi:hypothetical protein LCGC14_0783500 [marine sediment metagenome]|uniref:YprB ribonuclease H-like domain-containing protein n=1 Tax=marine sediment metagenome TaxID=412755 RepID=A0A0F9QEM2_9ZZZZ